ncbi:hypothetical protein ACGC1H_003104 [Rhizoctonia solani]
MTLATLYNSLPTISAAFKDQGAPLAKLAPLLAAYQLQSGVCLVQRALYPRRGRSDGREWKHLASNAWWTSACRTGRHTSSTKRLPHSFATLRPPLGKIQPSACSIRPTRVVHMEKFGSNIRKVGITCGQGWVFLARPVVFFRNAEVLGDGVDPRNGGPLDNGLSLQLLGGLDGSASQMAQY